MNSALFANADFLAPFQGLIRWWSGNRLSDVGEKLPKREVPYFAPKLVATNEYATGATAKNDVTQKPLRVLRIVESGQARASSGRMVISGRMADVCAELDRLAAREAALS